MCSFRFFVSLCARAIWLVVFGIHIRRFHIMSQSVRIHLYFFQFYLNNFATCAYIFPFYPFDSSIHWHSCIRKYIYSNRIFNNTKYVFSAQCALNLFFVSAIYFNIAFKRSFELWIYILFNEKENENWKTKFRYSCATYVENGKSCMTLLNGPLWYIYIQI